MNWLRWRVPGELVIYLDRFATNEQVDGATIEVETPAGPEPARAIANEPYLLSAPWSAKPGAYDLIFTVTKDGIADLLPLRSPSRRTVRAEMPERPRDSPYRRGRRNSGAVISQCPDRVDGRTRRLCSGNGRHDVDVAKEPAAMILILAGMLAMFNGGARAMRVRTMVRWQRRFRRCATWRSGCRRQRIRAQEHAANSGHPHDQNRIGRASPARSNCPGRIIPDPNASGFVQSSIGGRLSPPPNGFPRLGTPVKKGDVLAYMTPPLQAIDASDMRQRQGELDQQISIVERRLARYETLVPSGAIARTQLEDTRTELQGLKDRRGSLDKSRREPEELIAPVDGHRGRRHWTSRPDGPIECRSSSISSIPPVCG